MSYEGVSGYEMLYSSSCTYVSGLLLSVVSISTRSVLSDSKFRDDRPRLFFEHFLVLCTISSQNPPCHGTFSTLNSHHTPLVASCRWMSADRMMFFTSLAAALKVFALSVSSRAGRLLRAAKRRKASRNVSRGKRGNLGPVSRTISIKSPTISDNLRPFPTNTGTNEY